MSEPFRQIALIACASQKLPYPAMARELYTSTLFQLNLHYALCQRVDKVEILSAKYGLLDPDRVIEPYNVTLNTMSAAEVKHWSNQILIQLGECFNLKHDHFILLAGVKYRKNLTPHMTSYEVPMEGLPIGKQLQFLKSRIEELCPPTNTYCCELHETLSHLQRFTFPFDPDRIPLNGIYVLYEQGEFGHGGDRIVRVGTHTGDNQLRSRLQQHFIKENKDRSIFRKNIGRALLNRDGDPFLEQWEIDLTTRKAKERYAASIDMVKQQAVERRVTGYIQGNFSFVVLPVNETDERLSLEAKLISTVSWCDKCRPSADWLGRHSSKGKIRESGLWLVNELYKTPLSEEDLMSIN